MADIYADLFAVQSGLDAEMETVKIHFGLKMDKTMPNSIITTDIHAKELALVLMKVIKDRENVLGHPITLTENFYRQAGIAPEDYWNR